jgi:hypothetical protein
MINKSKLAAIAFIAAIGLPSLASPAFAAPYPNYGPQFYSPSGSGGGSIGYNELLMTHRLKAHHPRSPHARGQAK